MKRSKLLLAAAALLASMLVAGWWVARTVRDEYSTQARLGPRLQVELGFRIGTPVLRIGGSRVEVIALYPTPGGVMAKAGVRQGDALLGQRTIGQFYEMLQSSRGRTAVFQITDGGQGGPLEERPAKVITIRVPQP